MSEATSGEKGKNDETANSFTSKAKMNLNRYLKNTRNSRKRENANGEAATNSKRSSSYILNRSLPDYFDDFQDGEFKELSIEISTGNLPSGRNTNNGEISVVRKPRSSSSNLESSRAYKTTEIQLTPTIKRKPEAVYNGKEYELKKQIFFLQEELIRSKLLLDQSQTMRKLELEKFQDLEDRSNFIDGRMNSRSDIDNKMDLINQVTRLQASETMLKNSIENERLKVNRLNHQIFELNQKLYEAGVDPHTSPSMNDSLEGADLAKQLHIKIETSSQSSGSSSDNYPIIGPTARAKNDSGVNSQSELGFNDGNVADYPSLFKNEAQYYEILEKLRNEDEGLAIENPTYHDIVVHLYKQKQNAIKNLDEFSFYMKQMNIPRGGENKNPVESIKKVYFQMKANEDQINYLKEKVDSYKLGIEMQQIEYSTQLKSIWEENELLKERLRDQEQQQKQQQRQQRLVVAASNTEYSHELDTAAWQTASKSTTIPSHETTSKTYAIVSEEVSSVNKPLITYVNRHSSPLPMAKTHDRGMATDMTLFFNMGVQVDSALMLNSGVQCDLGTTTNYRGFDAVQNEPPAERDLEAEILAEREKLREAFENEIQVMLGRIGNEIDKNKVNKPNIEGQLGEILTELKRYQSENLNLSGRYDQYLTGLNEQLNSIKAENVRTKTENSDLKLKQNLNNAELSNIIENYGEELKRLNAEMDKSKENFDALKIENERLVEKNRDLVNSNDRLKKEIQTKNSECQNRTSQLKEAYSQVELIRAEFESVKRINESLVNEKSVFKQKNQRQNEEMFKKLESYENEISQLRKQVKQLELDSKKLEIDYSLKCDEASRLQRSLSEIDELREKCITCEQKLDYQVKINKTMQEKLYQLQLELVSKMPNQPQQIVTSATDASYESIIDDLKFIIHQQIAYRNPSPLADVEELKHKIHDLQLKLQHEKLQNERLEFKLKLVDQDNQQLKQALYSSNRKTANNDKTGKTRMEEMMDMIAKAQQNAQNILASNPNITEDLKNQQHLFTQSAVN